MTNADELRVALLHALDAAPRVVLDLSGVTFLDSTGLSALVAARNKAVQADSQVYLVGPRRNVARVLQISGLDQLFVIRGSVQEALAAEVPGRRDRMTQGH